MSISPQGEGVQPLQSFTDPANAQWSKVLLHLYKVHEAIFRAKDACPVLPHIDGNPAYVRHQLRMAFDALNGALIESGASVTLLATPSWEDEPADPPAKQATAPTLFPTNAYEGGGK